MAELNQAGADRLALVRLYVARFATYYGQAESAAERVAMRLAAREALARVGLEVIQRRVKQDGENTDD